MNERSWIDALRAGNPAALEDIMNAWTGPLYGFAARMLGQREEARDVVQETFIRLWQNRETWRAETSLKNWLFGIARNLCLNRLDLSSRKTDAGVAADEVVAADPAPSPEAHAENRQRQARLAAALKDLSPRQRETVLLRTEGGLSFEEIGRHLGVASATARANYFFAVRRLKALLSGKAKP